MPSLTVRTFRPFEQTIPGSIKVLQALSSLNSKVMASQQNITEMAFLPFPPQTPLHDPSTPAGAIWQRVVDEVSKAQGYCGQRWGYRMDESGIVCYLVGIYDPKRWGIPALW